MNQNVIVEFILDGRKASFETSPDKRLLDILREDAGINGVKEGCGEGECGACSVLRNGKLVNSCSVPVIAVHGDEILTIEGFTGTDEYRIISEAYAEAGAVQCGFCTPGFIMATAALLRNNPRPGEAEIRTALSGNLCRCTGYTMIIKAVESAAKRMASDEQ